MDSELRDAIRESFLANLPAPAVAALVDGAVRVHAPAGTRFSRSDGRPSVKLVANGLLRIVRTVADGRTITQRFLRRGDVAGIAMVFTSREGRATGACDAIMDSVVYLLSGEAWRLAALRDANVAVAMLSDLGRVLHELREENLVATRVGSVVLLDPERLRLELAVS